MSLTTIRDAAYQLLQLASPSSDDNVLMLQALNDARLKAERTHDWWLSYDVAYMSIAETGTLLSTAVAGFSSGAPSGSAVSVKKVMKLFAYQSTTAYWVPGQLLDEQGYHGLIERGDRGVGYSGWEWPTTDNVVGQNLLQVFSTRPTVYSVGPKMFLHNWSATTHLKLYVYKYLSAYSVIGASDDFLVTYASDWLMYEIALLFNLKRGTWLPRNEGSLSPDELRGRRDEAWESLLLWDAHLRPMPTDILA